MGRSWLLTALRPSQVVSAKLVVSLWPAVPALGAFMPLMIIGVHAARLPALRLLLLAGMLLAASIAAAALALWLSGRCRQLFGVLHRHSQELLLGQVSQPFRNPHQLVPVAAADAARLAVLVLVSKPQQTPAVVFLNERAGPANLH